MDILSRCIHIDDVSDGVINLCVETWDFRDDSVKFEFSRVQQ